MPRPRIAILEISRELLENLGLVETSVREVLDTLHIPTVFVPRESFRDWDTLSLKIRLESDFLPELEEDQLIPYISFTFEGSKVIGFTLTNREVIYYAPRLYPLSMFLRG